MAPPPSPGWYRDPSGTPEVQYWNGTGWVADQAPPRAAGPRRVPDRLDNRVHLVLTLVTCGLWLPAWLIIALLNHHMASVGPQPGVRGFLSAHPTPTGIGVLVSLVWLIVDWKSFVHVTSLAAVGAGLVVLAIAAVRSVQRRNHEKRELAARADDQHEAVMRGDEHWGVFGLHSADMLPPDSPGGKRDRRPLLAGVTVAAGVVGIAVVSTVDPRSAERPSHPDAMPTVTVPTPTPTPTVTVTQYASPPIQLPVFPIPALGVPLPFGLGSPSAPPAAGPPAAAVRMGQQAVDGNLTFVVTSVDRSKTLANPIIPRIQTTAAGTFLTAHLRITNGGTQPRVFVAADQKLKINGVTYNVDPAAALWTLTMGTGLGPGVNTAVALSFDVPADTPPAGILELHESSSSPGATVELLPAN